VFLVENGISRDRAYIKFGVFHEDKMIFPGVCYSQPQPNPSPLSEVRELCQAPPESWRDLSDWWVGWSKPGPDHGPDLRGFLCNLAKDANAVAESMAEELVDILRKHLEVVRDANRALQAAQAT
jgi:hypothetical protein